MTATEHSDTAPIGAHVDEQPGYKARPRLLFLCQTLPFPPDGGVTIRTYNILRLLARSFDITALCFYRAKDKPTEKRVSEGIEGLRPLAKIEAFPIPQEHSRARLLWDHLRSVLSGRAYTLYAYESLPFRERLSEVLRTEEFDLVHVDSLDLCGYLPLLRELPVVCVHHNVESALLRRRAENEVSPLRRKYISLQADFLEHAERRWCTQVELNVTVSDVDRRVFEQVAPGARFTVVPNGVDVEAFRPAPHEPEGGLVFVGGYSWFPNRDALKYFSEEIYPRLQAGGTDAPVQWVGDAPEEVRQSLRRTCGIDLTGYVPDIRPYVHSAACYVVPLRVGGGTRLKILDAWAMGKAVVSTSVGCEGLAARDGENILIRDDPEQFARAVRDVTADRGLRERLEQGARATAERLYDWNVIGDEMIRHYLSLVRGK